MITHSVFFKLKHPEGSEQERRFLKKAMALRSISGVRNFECVREVSQNNGYTLGLTMQFEDRASYDFYTEHPDHNRFVETIWIPEVENFIEIDYVDYWP
jgi:quinol monooxygenase YgiN